MKNLRRIFVSHYTVTFVSKGLILASGFVNSILLARLLGANGRGEIAAATLWPTLLISLGSLGLAEASLYYSAQDKQANNAVITAAFIFTLLLSGIVIGIGYVILPALLAAQTPSVIELSRASLLFVPFGMIIVHVSNIFRAQMCINLYNLLQSIIPTGLVLGAIGLAVTNNLTVATAVMFQLGLFIGTAIIAVVLLLAFGFYSRLVFNRGLMRDMINYGLRVYIGSLFSTANLRLDQVMLASLVSPEQLGLYVVAVKVAELPNVLGVVVQVIVVPSIARLPKMDDKIQTLTRIYQRFWMANIGLKLAFMVAAAFMIPFLYSDEFQRAVPIAAILIVGSIFLDGKQVLNGAAQALNAPWLGSRTEVVSAIINATLLVLLLPSTGITGAAIASLFAYVIGLYILVHALRHRFHIRLPLLEFRLG